ncbi:sensor histidine kinase [Cupriavidus agavae]|uniref:histidine kinase n=1 Tax=Cupriavidus agavae TaxID=1001822 RepID=A0A4Q7S994_9BURK|nr:ATP-binding protein [Cupriavidus agavae]RZT42360.1 signal transduction histidine kinase [Cupriavidus agavae]
MTIQPTLTNLAHGTPRVAAPTPPPPAPVARSLLQRCGATLARHDRARLGASAVILALVAALGWLGLHRLIAHVPPSVDLALLLLLACVMGLAIVAALCATHLLAVQAALMELASRIDDPPAPDEAGQFLPVEGPAIVRQLVQTINLAKQRCTEREAELLAVQASYAHDLRTPMTRLMLRAELIDEPLLRGAIERDLDEMRELAEASLACARMQGSGPQSLRQVDADHLLDALLHNYKDAGRPIPLDGHIGQQVLTCPHALRRILVNLIDNALRYGSNVRLAVYVEPQRLTLAVLDSGPGIAPAQLETVFQPWYRAPETAGRAPGSGLGLAIARRLAQAIRADLRLANRSEGGLEARLTLPL